MEIDHATYPDESPPTPSDRFSGAGPGVSVPADHCLRLVSDREGRPDEGASGDRRAAADVAKSPQCALWTAVAALAQPPGLGDQLAPAAGCHRRAALLRPNVSSSIGQCPHCEPVGFPGYTVSVPGSESQT